MNYKPGFPFQAITDVQPDTFLGVVTGVKGTIKVNASLANDYVELTLTIIHELGHVLGLTDAPDPSCQGHIMGLRLEAGTRSVRIDDCVVADDKWDTTLELQPAPDPYCDAYCWTSCESGNCPALPPGAERGLSAPARKL